MLRAALFGCGAIGARERGAAPGPRRHDPRRGVRRVPGHRARRGLRRRRRAGAGLRRALGRARLHRPGRAAGRAGDRRSSASRRPTPRTRSWSRRVCAPERPRRAGREAARAVRRRGRGAGRAGASSAAPCSRSTTRAASCPRSARSPPTRTLGALQHVSGVYVKGLKHNGTHWLDLLRLLAGEPRRGARLGPARRGRRGPDARRRADAAPPAPARGSPVWIRTASPRSRWTCGSRDGARARRRGRARARALGRGRRSPESGLSRAAAASGPARRAARRRAARGAATSCAACGTAASPPAPGPTGCARSRWPTRSAPRPDYPARHDDRHRSARHPRWDAGPLAPVPSASRARPGREGRGERGDGLRRALAVRGRLERRLLRRPARALGRAGLDGALRRPSTPSR